MYSAYSRQTKKAFYFYSHDQWEKSFVILCVKTRIMNPSRGHESEISNPFYSRNFSNHLHSGGRVWLLTSVITFISLLRQNDEDLTVAIFLETLSFVSGYIAHLGAQTVFSPLFFKCSVNSQNVIYQWNFNHPILVNKKLRITEFGFIEMSNL